MHNSTLWRTFSLRRYNPPLKMVYQSTTKFSMCAKLSIRYDKINDRTNKKNQWSICITIKITFLNHCTNKDHGLNYRHIPTHMTGQIVACAWLRFLFPLFARKKMCFLSRKEKKGTKNLFGSLGQTVFMLQPRKMGGFMRQKARASSPSQAANAIQIEESRPLFNCLVSRT